MRAAWVKAVGSRWARALLAAAWSAVSAGAVAAPSEAPDGAEYLGVRFGGDGASTRVVVDLAAGESGRLVADAAVSGEVIISLTPAPASATTTGAGHGLVQAWRLSLEPHGARLILDLAPGARVNRHFMLAPTEAHPGPRYVVDIDAAVPSTGPIASTTPAPGMAIPVPGPTIQPAPLARSARRRKVVVIDAGHGGHDPGAEGHAGHEKDVTLAAAHALEARLERLGRYKVVMTRRSDVYVPLETRVAIARKAAADLFISLHADSAGGDPTTHGASVYTLSDTGVTRVNYVLGPHEWFTRNGARKTDPAVGRILLDLSQRGTRNRSADFASLVIAHIADRVDLLARSRRDAGYFVLLAPDVPAALLEMGFITNPDDEARLTDPVRRDRLMDGVAAAIDDYFGNATRVAAR